MATIPARATRKTGARLTLRIDLGAGPDRRIGPGKIALLRAIRAHRSISAAGRSLGMSYRRAWLLVDAMNRLFRDPVVSAAAGGKAGGGAQLTALGERVVQAYAEIELAASRAAGPTLESLERLTS